MADLLSCFSYLQIRKREPWRYLNDQETPMNEEVKVTVKIIAMNLISF